jgi:hypothetical protein
LARTLEQRAEEISDDIKRLAEMLAELDLISEENPGTVRETGQIEVEHPEPRLYGLDVGDTIVATRMREDGRYEHAVLDEHGMPI